MGEIHEDVAGGAGVVERVERSGFQIQRDAGHPGALVEDAAIADGDDVRRVADVGKGQQPRRQFRADSRGVAHGQRNHRAPLLRSVRS